MSADVLREAARLMRDRATAADGAPSGAASWYRGEEVAVALTDGVVATEIQATKDGAHIASWHPVVALAVADWLDLWADEDLNLWDSHFTLPEERDRALTVARAYLGGA